MMAESNVFILINGQQLHEYHTVIEWAVRIAENSFHQMPFAAGEDELRVLQVLYFGA